MTSKIYLAAPLQAEKSLSMNLYAGDLSVALDRLEGVDYENITPRFSPEVPGWRKLWQRSVRYPALVRKMNRRPRNILHVLDHSYGHLCRHHRRSVVTCHDIAEYRVSQLSGLQFRRWRNRVEGLRAARHVIAISENTARDVKELLGIAEERVSVVHYGVDPLFRPYDRKTAMSAFPQLSGPELKILHVGSNILRKNIPVLIKALGLLRNMGLSFSFVKVGKYFTPEQERLVRDAGLEPHLIYLGSRALDELPLIYSLCDIFVFPSTYEGFGRPILEAQACGTAAVLSNSSCMVEVGGNAAIYFPADDPVKLAETLYELKDSERRRRLSEDGMRNASRFTWDAHARKVAEIYQKVSDEGKSV